MTTYFVGPSGNNANSGLSWALRRLTLTSIETLVVAGDVVNVGPGVYRETLTTTAAGGSVYTTGTVSVTNGSAVVTGSSTLWLANAFANGQFQVTVLAHGTDGVTNGTSTFTSSAGNFQAGHVGMTIRVGTKAAYLISAVAGPTSITITLPGGGAASPSAASGLTYDVGPERPIEILSVDSDTQLTLKENWSAPTFTGLAYTVWRDIKYIGDEGGTLTDGIGGVVRISGSNDDQTLTRATCILATTSYRTWRGFYMDSTTNSGQAGFDTSSGTVTITNQIVEDCTFSCNIGLRFQGSGQLANTARRCIFLGTSGMLYQHSAALSNVATLIENCLCIGNGTGTGFRSVIVGGVLIRNSLSLGNLTGVRTSGTALATGQAITVNNCLIYGNSTGFLANATTEIVEDYNGLNNNNTDRTSTTAGAHSQAYPVLPALALLTLHFVQASIVNLLSSYSAYISIAGLNPPPDDLFKTTRAATSSWGPIQYIAGQRAGDAGEPRGRRGGMN